MSYWNLVMPYLALNASMFASEMYSLQLYMNSSFSMSPAGGKLSAAAALGAALGTSLAAGAALAPVDAAREEPPPGLQAAIAAAAPLNPPAYRKPRRVTFVPGILRSGRSETPAKAPTPPPPVRCLPRAPMATVP